MKLSSLPPLPICEVLPEIQQLLQSQHQLVLEAPPGAGKTTLVPLALLDQNWAKGQRIIMLEPRRMAARNAALRMADLLNEKVGHTVGYRVRQDTCVSQQTRIEVITEGILTRMLMQDPSLEGIAAIIFDEFHERNLDGDLGLAFCLQSRELFREANNPLKIIVMSATLDSIGIAELLGKEQTPVVRSSGKMFPVDIIYQQAKRADDNMIERVTSTLLTAIDKQNGSILTFLPGQGEIHRVMQQLKLRLTDTKNIVLLPLYGALSLREQQAAIAPLADKSQRKIVFATDIAETSLTIEGITVVVDSGLCRQPHFDPATGMTRLRTSTISKDSSVQRMGRAGRLSAGVCYRLWNEEQQQQLPQQSLPEILQADLAPMVLQLLAWGVDDIEELHWLNPPPSGPFNQALTLLEQLGAITAKTNDQTATELCHWQLNDHGQQMAALPTHPRLAHMLLCSRTYQLQKTACALAALLADRSPLSREFGGDLEQHLAVIIGDTPCHSQYKGWLQRTRKQADTFKKRLPAFNKKSEPLKPGQAIGFLLACAYPDRIARRKTDTQQQYQLSNGRIAQIHVNDNLAKQEWLAVAELGGQIDAMGKRRHDTIYSGCNFDPSLFQQALQPLVKTVQVVAWQDDSQRLIAEQQQRVGKLIIQREHCPHIDPNRKRQALIELIKKRGLNLLPWTKSLGQWRARVNILFQHDKPSPDKTSSNKAWPDLSDSTLLATLEDWLAPYLDNINKLTDFKQLSLSTILGNLLPWPLPQQLDQLAPTHLRVPSGSNIQIDYSENPPVLKVKLQEMFGCTHTPTIANGNIKLVVHLLSPAGRPLQVTQDLAGFWQSSYFEVKKDMKGRYPKHPWPDDPLQALATKLTKNRLASQSKKPV